MNCFEFALVCHVETDPQSALEVLEEYGGEIAAGIALQISSGRDPHVVFTHESEDNSLLYYAGNRELGVLNGFPIPEGVHCFALAMPSDCAAAADIKKKLVDERRTFRWSK